MNVRIHSVSTVKELKRMFRRKKCKINRELMVAMDTEFDSENGLCLLLLNFNDGD